MKPKFYLGQDVRVSFIGKIIGLEDRSGTIKYTIKWEKKGSLVDDYASCNENCLSELEEPKAD